MTDKDSIEKVIADLHHCVRQGTTPGLLALADRLAAIQAQGGGVQAVAEVVSVRPDNYNQNRRIRWLTDAEISVGTKLYATPPAPVPALSQPGEVTEKAVTREQCLAACRQRIGVDCVMDTSPSHGDCTADNCETVKMLTAAFGAQTGGETDDDAEYNAHMEAQVREVYEWLRKRGLYDPRDYPEDEGPDVCDLLDQHENELCRQIPEDKRTPLQRAMDAIGAQTRGEGATVKDSLTAPEGWALVPVEPTGLMKDVGANNLPVSSAKPWIASDCYRAMLAAAPKPPQEGKLNG